MAYFAPDEVALAALSAALKRGVKIQILLPGPYTDTQFVASASRATWGALLVRGAEIYQYQPTMFHCKVLVVDGLWTSVGSTNFDNRSFRLNDEANLNVYDAQLAARQIEVFNADLQKSKRVTYEEWRRGRGPKNLPTGWRRCSAGSFEKARAGRGIKTGAEAPVFMLLILWIRTCFSC